MLLHPGKKIKEAMKDMSWTQRQFAFFLGKKVSEVNELINGKRNITVHRDILLSHVLGTTPKYRLNLQNDYDYELAKSEFDISKLPDIDVYLKKVHQSSEQDDKEITNNNIVVKGNDFYDEYDLGKKPIKQKKLPENLVLPKIKKNKKHKTDKSKIINKEKKSPISKPDKKQDLVNSTIKIDKKRTKYSSSNSKIVNKDNLKLVGVNSASEEKKDKIGKDNLKQKEHIFRDF